LQRQVGPGGVCPHINLRLIGQRDRSNLSIAGIRHRPNLIAFVKGLAEIGDAGRVIGAQNIWCHILRAIARPEGHARRCMNAHQPSLDTLHRSGVVVPAHQPCAGNDHAEDQKERR
jgi:hypothetical protein